MYPEYRILVIGAAGSGKETLCTRLRLGRFIARATSDADSYDPATLEAMTAWPAVIDGQECVIEAIVARAGDLRHKAMRSTVLCRGIHGVVVTYDLSLGREREGEREGEGENWEVVVEEQIREIRGLEEERVRGNEGWDWDWPVVVVGTKRDLVTTRRRGADGDGDGDGDGNGNGNGTADSGGEERQRRDDLARELVARWALLGSFETSAKTGEGVEEPFASLVREGWRRGKLPR